MRKSAHKIGAVFYVLWGIFHAYIGVLLLAKLFAGGTHSALAAIANALPETDIPAINDRVMNGVLEHYSWNLIWFGIYAIVLAVFMNWKNSPTGYWFNLVVVSLTDIGFIGAILLPGYITFAAGASGPILWLLAALFTTIGRVNGPAAINPRPFKGILTT
jgi:hypothetical protein